VNPNAFHLILAQRGHWRIEKEKKDTFSKGGESQSGKNAPDSWFGHFSSTAHGNQVRRKLVEIDAEKKL